MESRQCFVFLCICIFVELYYDYTTLLKKDYLEINKGQYCENENMTERYRLAEKTSVSKNILNREKLIKRHRMAKCRLCCDNDETINHTVSDCSNLAYKEYKCRQDWVGKIIYRKVCQRHKFRQADKLYLYNAESILENETLKIMWMFVIQIDHQIPNRRPDLGLNNKKKRTSSWEFLTFLRTIE